MTKRSHEYLTDYQRAFHIHVMITVIVVLFATHCMWRDSRCSLMSPRSSGAQQCGRRPGVLEVICEHASALLNLLTRLVFSTF